MWPTRQGQRNGCRIVVFALSDNILPKDIISITPLTARKCIAACYFEKGGCVTKPCLDLPPYSMIGGKFGEAETPVPFASPLLPLCFVDS